MAEFRLNGDVVLYKGLLLVEQLPGALAPQSSSELIVRHGSANIARLDFAFGHLRIKGSLSTGQSTLSPTSAKELVIKSPTQVLAIIDENGNLKVRGQVFHFVTPN